MIVVNLMIVVILMIVVKYNDHYDSGDSENNSESGDTYDFGYFVESGDPGE